MERQTAAPLESIAAAWSRLTGGELRMLAASELPRELRPLVEAVLPDEPLCLESQGERWWVVGLGPDGGEPLLVATASRQGPWKQLVRSWAALLAAWMQERDVSAGLSQELLRAWDRLTFLFQILQSMGESGDLQTILDRIAPTLAHLFRAQAVVLEVRVGEQAIRSASGATVDEFPAEWGQRAVAAGAPLVMDLPASAQRPEGGRLVLSPLRSQSGLRGWIAFIDPPAHSLDAGDLQLLGSLAEYVAALLEAAHMRETREEQERTARELEVAAEIQRSLLPSRLPELKDLRLRAMLRPARQAGGDFYDVAWGKDGAPFILLADVSGKGMPAALLTAIVHTAFHELAPQHQRSAQLMAALNRALYQDLDRAQAFVTVALAHLRGEGAQIEYTSAGHVDALLWRAGGTSERFPADGLPLGIQTSESYESASIPMRPGDLLLLCSDGLTEALNEWGEPFGTQRLLDIMDIAHQAGADELMQVLVAAVESYSAELPLGDDLALIMFTRAADSRSPQQVWPFVCKGEISALRPIYSEALDWMLETARSWAQRKEVEDFLFAFWEVLKNQVSHALKEDAGLISGKLIVTPERLEAHLYDRGAAFADPPGAGREAMSETSAEGGYGFRIVEGLVDQCRYERLPDGRNHWQLARTRQEE